jgi:hypothetical protein
MARRFDTTRNYKCSLTVRGSAHATNLTGLALGRLIVFGPLMKKRAPLDDEKMAFG